MKSTYNLETGFFNGNFPDNELPNGCGFSETNYQMQFIKGLWNGAEWIEGASAEEINNSIAIGLLKSETELYRKRQCDGVDAYAEISAEFRLAKLNGIISEQAHGFIERSLIPVRNEVLSGQWISAKNELETIGNSIGQELYDRLHLQITEYINNNY